MPQPNHLTIINQGAETKWHPPREVPNLRLVEPPKDPAPSYRIGHPRVPRSERAGTQMVGVLVLIFALCIGVPVLVYLAGLIRTFVHSIG